MSMPIGLLPKQKELIAEARAALINSLAYLDLEDIIPNPADSTNMYVQAAQVIGQERFREMVHECEEIALNAYNRDKSPFVDDDLLESFIYEDARTNADAEIAQRYRPWWMESEPMLFDHVKSVASSRRLRIHRTGHRAHRSHATAAASSGGDSGDSDGGDGEPPRPHSSFLPPHHHHAYHSCRTIHSVTLNILGVAA